MSVPTADLSTAAPPVPARRDVRSWVFRAAVALIAVFVLAGPGGLVDLGAAVTIGDPTAEKVLHRWHHIDIGAYLSLLTVGTLVVAAWRPRQAALAVQVTLVSLAVFAGAIAASVSVPGPVLVPVAVVAALLIAATPDRRALAHLHGRGVAGGTAVLGAVVATPFLAANLWDNATRQAAGGDVHALLGHWAGGAALAAALLVTVWAGIRRGATPRGLRLVAAVTLGYLGVAALAHGSHDGAWSAWGATTATLAAVLLALSTITSEDRP